MIAYLMVLDWPTIALHGLWLVVGVLVGFLLASIMAMGGECSRIEEKLEAEKPAD